MGQNLIIVKKVNVDFRQHNIRLKRDKIKINFSLINCPYSTLDYKINSEIFIRILNYFHRNFYKVSSIGQF